MTESSLLIDRDDGVLSIVLNRPERKNALTRELIATLLATLEAADDDVRAVVISGNGKTFSSGVDLNDPAILEGPPFAEVLHGLAGAIRAFDKPVIAAMQWTDAPARSIELALLQHGTVQSPTPPSTGPS